MRRSRERATAPAPGSDPGLAAMAAGAFTVGGAITGFGAQMACNDVMGCDA